MTRRRIVLLSAAAVVALVGAALLTPLSSFRGPIETAASGSLGRAVTIRGSMHLTLFPELGVALKDVSVANSPGAHDPEMMTVGKIIVGARLGPLLSGRLEVTKVKLKQPAINFEIGKDGVANWQFGEHAYGAAENPFADGRLGIKQVSIENGEISYFDARNGRAKALSAVELTLDMTGSAAAGHKLAVAGTATYNAVPIKLAASLADLDGFIKGQPSDATVQVGSAKVDADFVGRLTAPGTLNGDLKLTAPSLRALAAWGGQPLPPGNGLGAVTITAAFSSADEVAMLSKAAIELDGMKLAGDLTIDARSKLPSVKGKLEVDHVNLTPYLGPPVEGDLAKAGQQVGRDTPLAFGTLKGLDADLTLTVGSVALHDLRVDHAVAAVALHAGVLKAELTSLTAYGGSGRGSLTVDTTGSVPAMHQVLEMSGVRVEQFLAQVAGNSRVSATGSVRLDVSARGESEGQLLRGLGGRASIALANGSVTGVDLGGVAHAMQSVLAGHVGGMFSNTNRAEFGSFSATFAIQNGAARTTDLRVTGPELDAAGSGTANLVTHAIDFRLNAKPRVLVPGLNLVDVTVPVSIRGTWDNPTFDADAAAGVASGVVGTVGGLGNRAAQLPGQVLKAPGDVLHSLFGGN